MLYSHIEFYQKITSGKSIPRLTQTTDSSQICNKQSSKLPIILVGSLANNGLRYAGGTGHWYHMSEYIFPYLKSPLQYKKVKNLDESSLLFVFQEKFAVEALVPFVRLLFTAVFSTESVRYVYFLWAEHIIYHHTKNNNTTHSDANSMLLSGIHISFVVDLREQTTHELFKFNSQNTSFSTSSYLHEHQQYQHQHQHQHQRHIHRLLTESHSKPVCVYKLLDFDWEHSRSPIGWFTSTEDFHYFTNIIHRLCKSNQSTRAGSSSTSTSRQESSRSFPTYTPMNQSQQHSRTIRRRMKSTEEVGLQPSLTDDAYIWKSVDKLPKPLKPAPIITTSNKRLLIYQRDKTRSLLNLNHIVSQLELALNKGVDRGVGGSESSSRNSSAVWSIDVITHNDLRAPCELIETMRSATVLLTPHGFQSMMLLFQPEASIFIEVHPYMYFMPHYFGTIQSSLRQYGDIQRSYLTTESISHSWVLSFLNTFGIINNVKCAHSSVCRYIARLQDVSISENFINRVVIFIHSHIQ
eukprot:gene8561-17659_t